MNKTNGGVYLIKIKIKHNNRRRVHELYVFFITQTSLDLIKTNVYTI